jgi:pyruvate/2-oxoglutarate dehydrogenase complex dihydrolipoamide dehydrogenase (E3) component
VPLRSFDSDVVERVLRYMKAQGTSVLEGVLPVSIERLKSGKLRVVYSSGEVDEFDTVFAAVGDYLLLVRSI